MVAPINVWLAVGSKDDIGQLVYSHDNGKNWNLATIPDNMLGFWVNTSGGGIEFAYDGKETFVLANGTRSNGTLGYSTDEGKRWRLGNTNGIFEGGIVNSVAYGNDKFLAVGAGSDNITGTMASSTDGGKNWVRVNVNGLFPYYLNGIAYDGTNTFVVVANDGTIGYSPNGGETWYLGESNLYLNSSVTYGQCKFVAVGAIGGVGYSVDGGRTWTLGNTNSITYSLYGIAYDGKGTFLVSGFDSDNNGVILSSTDGINWILEDISELFIGGIVNSVAYNGRGKWIAVGNSYDGTMLNSIIASSTDGGQTWVERNTNELFTGGIVNSVAYSIPIPITYSPTCLNNPPNKNIDVPSAKMILNEKSIKIKISFDIRFSLS